MQQADRALLPVLRLWTPKTLTAGLSCWGLAAGGGGKGAEAGAGAEKSWKGGGGKEDEDDEGKLRVRGGGWRGCGGG